MTRKEIREQSAKYLKFVEWSDEDKVFIGRCPQIMSGGIHGHDEAAVYKELCDTVEEWVELIDKENSTLPIPLDPKEFSGKFVLRMEPELHRRLAAKARGAGESLNSYVTRALVKA